MAAGGALAVSSGENVSSEHSEEAQAGTHVTFETTANAITNYGVDGNVLVSSVEVESRSDAEQRGAAGVDVGVSAMTNVEGSGLSVNSQTDTRVEIAAESGATVESHDSHRGHLLVRAEDDGQFVGANISGDAEAEQESESQVVVTHDDGTQGTFIVIGDGEVTVNDEGNVTAELEEGSSLTYRQYSDERDEADEEQERMIAEGTAAAEVYVTMAAEDGSEAAADVVQYSEDTTVEVVSHSENEIRVTAERTEEEGRVIITSVSEQAYEAADEFEVTVDGEAAAQAESTSELEAAADGGDNSAYMVRQASTVDASTEVLVAVNHFSERDVVMSSDEGSDDSSATDGDDGDDSGGLSDAQPGFGVVLGIFAALLATLFAARRQ